MRARLNFLSPPYVRVLHINIGFKHDVLVCSNGIAKLFENLKYVRPPNEGIVGCVLIMFSMMGGVLQTPHI
jgi:hypothetical protein